MLGAWHWSSTGLNCSAVISSYCLAPFHTQKTESAKVQLSAFKEQKRDRPGTRVISKDSTELVVYTTGRND